MGKRKGRFSYWSWMLLPIALLAFVFQTGGAGAAARAGDFPAFIAMPGVSPRGVAVDRFGNVYVSIGEGAGTAEYMKIWKFTPDGKKFPAPFADIGLGTFGGLMFSGDGDLYVAMGSGLPTGSARGVWRVDAKGQKELLPNSDKILFANGLAFDDHGILYITETASMDAGKGGIWRIPPGGQAELCVRDVLLTGTKALGNPIPIGANGIAYFDGYLYVTNTEKSTVLRIPVSNGVVGAPEVWVTLQEVPESPLAGFPIPPMGDGLIVDGHGNPCVAVLTRAAVVRISLLDKSQETIAAFPAGSLDFPASLWFAPGNGAHKINLFVTDLGMGIKFMPQLPWPGPGLARIDLRPIDLVSRPFTITAYSQMVVNTSDGNFTAEAWGNATHFGEVTMAGWGNTGKPVGWGTITAANGDFVGYKHNAQTGVVTFTGGTGRFLGATGEFLLDAQLVGQESGPSTVIYKFVWTGSGTITY